MVSEYPHSRSSRARRARNRWATAVVVLLAIAGIAEVLFHIR